MKKNGGFALTELLVALIILGIITGIIIVNASKARIQAADAEIKTNLGIIQSKAELYYDTGKTYGTETIDCAAAGTMFTNNTVIAAALAAAQKASGGSGTNVVCAMSDNTTAPSNPSKTWAVSVKLRSDPTKWWCVDWKNVASTTNASVATTSGAFKITDLGDPNGIAKCP